MTSTNTDTRDTTEEETRLSTLNDDVTPGEAGQQTLPSMFPPLFKASDITTDSWGLLTVEAPPPDQYSTDSDSKRRHQNEMAALVSGTLYGVTFDIAALVIDLDGWNERPPRAAALEVFRD